MNKLIRTALRLVWILAAVAASAAQSEQVSRDQIYSALTGSWTGQLEYRDFQTDERVVLPSWLEVKPSSDMRSVEFDYVYDDGPSKTVTEVSKIDIDPVKRQYTVTSDRDHSSDTYQIESLVPGRAGRFRMVLTGTGTENDQKVDVRITISIDRNLYQFKKETRLAGKEFNFRDGYVLTRRNPANK